jgi:cysteine desulfurase
MERIYLDHASVVPVDARVLRFAEPYLAGGYGNPSSLHSVGLEARRAVEDARTKVADLINAEKEKTILYTSGATEANNLAIKGAALRNIGKGKKIVSSAIEHMSVLNPMKDLQKNEFEFTTVPVDSSGIVDLEKLEDSLTKETTVTSIMYANNEIGHVDATAAAGRIPIDVQADGIDLLTLSSNDMYGPQGAGALYVKTGVRIQPVLPGGGQERGLRSGTENVFAVAGMGEAARIAKEEMSAESARLSGMRENLIEEILKIEETYLTGHRTKRLPHHASFRFSHIEGESILLLMDAQGMQVSTGSACSSKTLEPSHVLLAMGLKHEEAHGSMVMTLGRSNTIEQVPRVVDAVNEMVVKLRKISSLSKE